MIISIIVIITVMIYRDMKFSLSPNPTGYLISYTTTASYTSGGNVTVNGHSTTSHILSNLEEGTFYTITVRTQ